MRLNGQIEGKVLRAFEDSFDRNRIQIVLRRELGMRLDNIVSDGRPWPNIVDEIYQEFYLQNTVERLLVVLRDARPSVPEFALALDDLGFTQIDGEGHTGRTAMEALLSRRKTPFQDVEDFRGRLSGLESQVCQVAGSLVGTGSLIAPDIVLTNQHVVAKALHEDQRTLTSVVTCVFDHKAGGAKNKTNAREITVAHVEACSPHAHADEQPGKMTESFDFLDYALLRLRQPVGDLPIIPGGDLRGFMDLSQPDEAMSVGSALLILQHPGGLPMKIDIGSVLAQGPARLRHNVNTKPGSSGSPIFNAALQLVAVHHCGHENGPTRSDPGYNQAIPMNAILTDARNKGVAI